MNKTQCDLDTRRACEYEELLVQAQRKNKNQQQNATEHSVHIHRSAYIHSN